MKTFDQVGLFVYVLEMNAHACVGHNSNELSRVFANLQMGKVSFNAYLNMRLIFFAQMLFLWN